MRARDQPLAGHVAPRAFVRARDARHRRARRRSAAPRSVAPAADRLEPGRERRVRRIDLQRDDVDREVLPAHRQLGPADEADSRRVGGRAAPRPARDVRRGRSARARRRPRAAARATTSDGRQQAVGMGRMAVEVETAHDRRPGRGHVRCRGRGPGAGRRTPGLRRASSPAAPTRMVTAGGGAPVAARDGRRCNTVRGMAAAGGQTELALAGRFGSRICHWDSKDGSRGPLCTGRAHARTRKRTVPIASIVRGRTQLHRRGALP